MAEGDGLIYNNFKEQVMEGVFNLATGGDTIKQILLASHTADIDGDTVYADVSGDEFATAAGYTAGGVTLSGQDVTQDNTNDRGAFDATDPSWTGLGPLASTPSHTAQYDDTPSSPADPVIAVWELGTTAPNGGNYTLQFGANGILLLT